MPGTFTSISIFIRPLRTRRCHSGMGNCHRILIRGHRRSEGRRHPSLGCARPPPGWEACGWRRRRSDVCIPAWKNGRLGLRPQHYCLLRLCLLLTSAAFSRPNIAPLDNVRRPIPTLKPGKCSSTLLYEICLGQDAFERHDDSSG